MTLKELEELRKEVEAWSKKSISSVAGYEISAETLLEIIDSAACFYLLHCTMDMLSIKFFRNRKEASSASNALTKSTSEQHEPYKIENKWLVRNIISKVL